MSDEKPWNSNSGFAKAKDLKVKFKFATDESKDSEQRTQQAQAVIAEMLVIAHRRGRPSKKEVEIETAA